MNYINRNNVSEAVIVEPRNVKTELRPILNGWQLKIYFNNGNYTIIDYNSKDECVKAINKLKLTEI